MTHIPATARAAHSTTPRNMTSTRHHAIPLTSVLALTLALSGCASIEGALGGDKIDYRSMSTKTSPLEVPPDLTKLTRDSRYLPQGNVVSASTYGRGVTVPATAAAAVAPRTLDGMRIERAGNQRWLVTTQTPEQLWPQIRAFWQERGFTLGVDSPEAGVMETDWAENRAKLPKDAVRATLGRLVDGLYSTGERDRFRTRVERVSGGTEVYISHRGMQEVFVSKLEDQTAWTQRPVDASLEAEMLSRLMVKLGAPVTVATAAVASATSQTAPAAAKARALATPPATLQVDEPFDRAWRRVGVALDRSGFTVEDRDRNRGMYFVRYIDPKVAARDEPGFFAKLMNLGRGDKQALTGPNRYRIVVQAAGERSTVSVTNAQGAPETTDIGKRIVQILVDDLK